MAKVTIVIEDSNENNKVRMTCTPSYKQMAQAIIGGHERSAAFAMAVAIANFIVERDKKIAMGHKKSNLIIPRLKPGRMQ